MNVSTAASDIALNGHAQASLALAAVMFALLIWDRLPIATVCLGVLGLLSLGFELYPLVLHGEPVSSLRFFSGIGHPALVAICALMVLGRGLVVTGAMEPLANVLAEWVVASPRLALLAVMLVAASTSGVVNDTPVVVLLIPLLLAAAQRASISATALLLPMNYAVLIGGMATTIGTSTNLIVVSIAVSLGLAPMGLFEFFPLVAAAAVPALAYLWLVSPLLLKGSQQVVERLSEPVFDAELHVQPGSWLDGRTWHEVLSSAKGQLARLELRRHGHLMARLPTLRLKAGDRLLLRDTVAHLKAAEQCLQTTLHRVEVDAPAEASGASQALSSAVVAQLIITSESPLVGRTVRQQRMAERHDLTVVGHKRRRQSLDWQPGGLSDWVVSAGDILLVQGSTEAVQAAQQDGLGLLLDSQLALPRKAKAPLALVTMGVVVLLAATKMLPIALAALGGVLVLLLGRGLSWDEVAQSLSVKVILLVAASLAVGDALELTGGTAYLAHQLSIQTQHLSPAWVLVILMGLMGLFTNFVSNNAAAAIGTPLGVALAHSLGLPPEPFVLAVLFGCNLCYLTPMGYQTNLLVMNAGGYRFADFVRVGAPLFIIMWAALSWGLVVRYGL